MFTLGIKEKKVFFYLIGISAGWVVFASIRWLKVGTLPKREFIALRFVVLYGIPRVITYIVRIVFFRWQKQHRFAQAMHLKFLQIKISKSMISKSSEMDADDHIQQMKQVVDMMNQIYKNFYAMYDDSRKTRTFGQEYISLEVCLDKEVIRFMLGVPEEFIDNTEKFISSFYPGASIDPIEQPKYLEAGKYMAGGDMILAEKTIAPIKTYEGFEVDPMDSILSAYSRVLQEEKLVLQILIAPIDKDLYEKLRKDLDSYKKCRKKWYVCMRRSFWKNLTGGGDDKKGDDDDTKFDFSQQQTGELDKKIEDELFEVKMRVFAASPEAHRPARILADLTRAFNQYNNIGLNHFTYAPAKNMHQFAKNLVLRSFFSEGFLDEKIKQHNNPMYLNIKELSSIVHFPHSRFNRNPRIQWQKFKIVPAPDNLSTDGVLLGYNIFGGVKKEVRISNKDRFRHLYVIGQTGTGKSVNLLNIATQDVANGNGFCLIDPHGDLCEHVLKYMPRERIDDLIYFDFANTDYPIGFNVLEGGDTADERDIITNDLVEMFVNMYGHEIFGPRIQDYFRNGCLLLMEQPEGGTLTEIIRIFVDEAYMESKLKHLKDPVVSQWWNKTYKTMGEREKGEMIPFFQAKFGPFTTGSFVRNVIGQPKSGFRFGKAMQEKKIILCNLSKGLTGEVPSQLIGRMFGIQIKLNALKRAAIAEEDRVPFFLFVDEFQNYVSQSFESILSEARKYRLGLCVAHQYIEQLKSTGLGGNIDMSKPIFGNVGSQLYLKVGPEDAEFLEKNVTPEFTKGDLLNMDKFKGICMVSVDTQPSRPFSLNCLNPYLQPPINSPEKVDIIKQISALKRGTKRELAEKEIYYRVGV